MPRMKFMGVYSSKNRTTPSAGKQLYFVWKMENSSFAAQKLDKAHLPVGKPKILTPAQLQSSYKFEPNDLAAPMSLPDLSALEPPREKSAVSELTDDTLRELEKARKAKQVEADLRNNFDKALRALNRPRDRKGALAALERFATQTEGIVPAHKHMFRDFGVSLRKKSLPELALQYAGRVVELAPNDDHAHFNMARIMGILGMYDEAEAHLRKAIELDHTEIAYRKLMAYLERERDGAVRR